MAFELLEGDQAGQANSTRKLSGSLESESAVVECMIPTTNQATSREFSTLTGQIWMFGNESGARTMILHGGLRTIERGDD
ncbi:MAG: hypothetical protein DWI11_03605 [Planctomycetota bacterium]|nr:MAG: hypothetical protein DWI11_03605 [Planctomycetota bacterium]